MIDKNKIYPLTQFGNAERFQDDFGHIIKYSNRRWYLWLDTHWGKVDNDQIKNYAKQSIRKIDEEILKCDEDGERANLKAWSLKSEKNSEINAILNLSKIEPGFIIQSDKWDSNPMLLNVQNGTIDLSTGKLLPHAKENFITKRCNVMYDENDENAPRSQWLSFINSMFETTEMVEFVQRCLGYSITGDVSEQVLFMLTGSGSNGKSTLINVLSSILNNYSIQCSSRLFLKSGANDHPTASSDLQEMRLAIANETGADEKLNEVLIKQLTGGDMISTRRMRKNFFVFKPKQKIWIINNLKPNIANSDHGIWRRLIIINIDNIINAEDQDKELEQKLFSEAPGILNWLIEGCLNWKKYGLNPPDKVKSDLKEFRIESDNVFSFVENFCIKEKGAITSIFDLYREYENVCEKNSESCVSKKIFGQKLVQIGFPNGFCHGGKKARKGLRLKALNQIRIQN